MSAPSKDDLETGVALLRRKCEYQAARAVRLTKEKGSLPKDSKELRDRLLSVVLCTRGGGYIAYDIMDCMHKSGMLPIFVKELPKKSQVYVVVRASLRGINFIFNVSADAAEIQTLQKSAKITQASKTDEEDLFLSAQRADGHALRLVHRVLHAGGRATIDFRPARFTTYWRPPTRVFEDEAVFNDLMRAIVDTHTKSGSSRYMDTATAVLKRAFPR